MKNKYIIRQGIAAVVHVLNDNTGAINTCMYMSPGVIEMEGSVEKFKTLPKPVQEFVCKHFEVLFATYDLVIRGGFCDLFKRADTTLEVEED